MKVSLEIPEEIDKMIMTEAKKDGHESRSAVIRKAIAFYFATKSQKVAS
jgi:Arc/MetJ-type ribon-helix-helix transcriptional regulator